MRHVAAGLALAICLFAGEASAQSVPQHWLSQASTNCTLVQAGRTLLTVVLPVNTTTTIYYLKFFDKATAPVAGTDTPKWTIPVPYGASNSGGGVSLPTTQGLEFLSGLGFCLVGGIADNDSSNAATGVAINIGTQTQ